MLPHMLFITCHKSTFDKITKLLKERKVPFASELDKGWPFPWWFVAWGEIGLQWEDPSDRAAYLANEICMTVLNSNRFTMATREGVTMHVVSAFDPTANITCVWECLYGG